MPGEKDDKEEKKEERKSAISSAVPPPPPPPLASRAPSASPPPPPRQASGAAGSSLEDTIREQTKEIEAAILNDAKEQLGKVYKDQAEASYKKAYDDALTQYNKAVNDAVDTCSKALNVVDERYASTLAVLDAWVRGQQGLNVQIEGYKRAEPSRLRPDAHAEWVREFTSLVKQYAERDVRIVNGKASADAELIQGRDNAEVAKKASFAKADVALDAAKREAERDKADRLKSLDNIVREESVKRTKKVVVAGIEGSGKTEFMAALYAYCLHNKGMRFIYGEEEASNRFTVVSARKAEYNKTLSGKINPAAIRSGYGADAKYFVIWDISGEDFTGMKLSEAKDLKDLLERAQPTEFFKKNMPKPDKIIAFVDIVREQSAITDTSDLGRAHGQIAASRKCEHGKLASLAPDNSRYVFAGDGCRHCERAGDAQKRKVKNEKGEVEEIYVPAYAAIALTLQEKLEIKCKTHDTVALKKNPNDTKYVCPETNCGYSQEAQLDFTNSTQDYLSWQVAFLRRLVDRSIVSTEALLPAIPKIDTFMSDGDGVKQNIIELYRPHGGEVLRDLEFVSSWRVMKNKPGGMDRIMTFLNSP